MIKKTARKTGLIVAALILIAGVIFAFTKPILAPGFDAGTLSLNHNTDDNSNNTFTLTPNDSRIGPDVKADSYLIYNETSGKIIAAKNPDTALAIASLTKLMTAYMVDKYGNLTDEWAINQASTNDIRPVLGLTIGDRVKVHDLINAMLIGSANDAASALGAYISSIKNKPIVELMNQEAKDLGMHSTHYENAIGFDSEQNYSTANDLKILLDKLQLLSEFADIDRKQAYSFTSETGQQYSVKATNTLQASDPDIHAIKTGFTDQARGAMITAIHHDDKKFVIIVLGSPDREADTKLLKTQTLSVL
jgi:D-alanyl-D-alanine carboxypeptidase (penicillin-binding protein 5/6)